jgi:hypothetical protein
VAAVQERVRSQAKLSARERDEAHGLGLTAQPRARPDHDPRIASRDHDQTARRAVGVDARAELDARARLEHIARRGEIRARARLEREPRVEPAQTREPQPIPALDDPQPDRPEPTATRQGSDLRAAGT